jgi:lipoate-protein ligase A
MCDGGHTRKHSLTFALPRACEDSPVPVDQQLRLVRDSFPDRPAFGTAISEAILTRVAAGELEATMRLHRPGPELALSKQDAVSPGFGDAIAAGRAAGFQPVLRLAGGRAAAFHEGTLALARSTPAAYPARTTRERFEQVSGALAQALRGLGVDARVGEIPGEYCPGAWSVNARGATKLVGIGQRLISGGAHVGAVIVVADSPRLRSLLEAVYAALDLDWDPATVGSVEDEVGPVALHEVEDALLAELGAEYDLVPAQLDPATLELAARLEAGRRLDPAHEPRRLA